MNSGGRRAACGRFTADSASLCRTAWSQEVNRCGPVEGVTRQSSEWPQAPKGSFSNEMEGSRHVCLDAARKAPRHPRLFGLFGCGKGGGGTAAGGEGGLTVTQAGIVSAKLYPMSVCFQTSVVVGGNQVGSHIAG